MPTMVSTQACEFLTMAEAMQISRMSRATLTSYAAQGLLRICQPKRCGKMLIRRAELERFLNGQPATNPEMGNAHAS
jgi:predicted site-specific integrase-resolvase